MLGVLVKGKSNVCQTVKNFFTMHQNKFQTNIQEYFNTILDVFFLKNGIVHQSSCSQTPQQNEVVERKNRHLLKVARALLFSNKVPNYLWDEFVLTAPYVINRMPSEILNFQTPINIFKEYFPSTCVLTEDSSSRGDINEDSFQIEDMSFLNNLSLHVPQNFETFTSAPTENGHDSLSDSTHVMSKELCDFEPTFSLVENNKYPENDDNDDLIEMPQNNESLQENKFELGNKTWKGKVCEKAPQRKGRVHISTLSGI